MPLGHHWRITASDQPAASNRSAGNPPAGNPRTDPAILGGIGLLIAGCVGLVILDAREGTLRDRFVTETVAWYLLAFVGFAVAIWANERSSGARSIPLRWVWGIGIALRLLMLFTTPTLSDDVYRYIWEGHLVAEGVSPYEFTIDDPAGEQHAIEARELANNRTLASPYLPTVPLVFGAVLSIFPPEPLTMQVTMIAFDLIAAFVLSRLLALAALPARRVALYLLHPFAIVEIGHGAHLDALMMALAAAGVLLSLRSIDGGRAGSGSRIAGAVLLALATLTRPIPALLVPVLFWRWNWPQRIAYSGVVGGLIVAFGLGAGFGLTGEPTGTGVFGSARAYTETFRFNSAIYQTVETWIASQGLDDKGWNEPVALTRLVMAALVLVVMLVIWARSRRLVEPLAIVRMAIVPLAMYTLLTPVLHPWYLLIVILFVPLLTPTDAEAADGGALRWLLALPWLYLSGALVLSYLTYRDPAAFAELKWVRRVEWVPTVVLLAGAVAMTTVRSMRLRGLVRTNEEGQ